MNVFISSAFRKVWVTALVLFEIVVAIVEVTAAIVEVVT